MYNILVKLQVNIKLIFNLIYVVENDLLYTVSCTCNKVF